MVLTVSLRRSTGYSHWGTWIHLQSLFIITTTFFCFCLSDAASFASGIVGDASSRFRNHPRRTFGLANIVKPSGRNKPNEQCWAETSRLSSENPSVDRAESDAAFYVHIPYCRRRCRYCDFAIVPIGPVETSGREEMNSSFAERQNTGFRLMDISYRDTVLAEIEMILRTTKRPRTLRSIYFGGGTPSLAPVSSIKSILEAILDGPNSPFVLADDAEITIEMDPGTFDLTKLRSLKEIGFNRISLGVQSFDDSILEAIGRVHRCSDVLECINMIKTVFGDEANYSIDLISGLPGLNLAKWVETLQTALSFSPNHLSLYDLQVEQGTVFHRWYREDDDPGPALKPAVSYPADYMPLPSVGDCAFMYKYASGYLKSRGYEHYEISSYAYTGSNKGAASSPRRNGRSRHNQIYWEIGSDWYAAGLGATSSLNRHSFQRPRQMADYLSWVKGQDGKDIPSWLLDEPSIAFDVDCRSDDIDFLSDTIMTRLRTADGLSLDWIANTFQEGETKVSAVLRGAELALSLDMAHTVEENNAERYLRLSDPVGFLFSNSIISSIFVELEGVCGH
uniref:Radical S-adenosyl methionine domain-containing protein 1, mitochondrial n=2 Tax=Odontella aurita TaxID=265563 RepID=A0A7S4JB43_9STRA|mmetsp:Transcript_4290/g.11958  ORF Transcript_4290/g.11958 Transcript_4290/m.11958 type:complete len:564 (+) Transcript_4290:317-2008(+)